MRKIQKASFVKIFHPRRVNSIEHMTTLVPSQMPKERQTGRGTEAYPSWLIAKCIAGYEGAIEIFVRQHETGVFQLALSIVGDPAEANEITQETFIAALRSLRSYQEQRSLKAWLYTIALNRSE